MSKNPVETPVRKVREASYSDAQEEKRRHLPAQSLRIAIDVSPVAQRVRGGIPLYILNIVNHLAKADHENEYYLCYRLSRIKKRKYFLKTENGFFKTKIFQEPFSFFFPRKLNVFHGTDSRLPKFNHVKKVVTIHDIFSIISNHFADARFRENKIKRYHQAIERADLIIADSMNTQKDLVERLDVPQAKIRTIHLGVGDEFSPRSPEAITEVREKYGLKRDYILYVGSISRRKNIGHILSAFTWICARTKRDIDLVIAGYGGYGYKEFLLTVPQLKVRDRIRHLGYVEEADLPTLYSGAEFFIFPTLYEGFGLPILEAFASGTPVLTSNTSSIPEVAGDAALLVNPLDVEEITEGALRILENQDFRDQLVQKGLERAQQFSWEKAAEKTLAVYRELAS